MKGFRNSTRSRPGWDFPVEKGFSNSSGKVQTVGPYNRTTPTRKAEGTPPEPPKRP